MRGKGQKKEGAKGTPPEADEGSEQRALIHWAAVMTGRHPELRLLYHIPNEGKRSARTGARLLLEGLRPGFPDLGLPVARGGKHGLYIELKRPDGGKMSEDQAWWLEALRAAGNEAVVCNGWDEAREVILEYLGRKNCRLQR